MMFFLSVHIEKNENQRTQITEKRNSGAVLVLSLFLYQKTNTLTGPN